MRMRRSVVVLATVAFAIAAPLGAGAAASSSSPGTTTGSIAGTVTGQGDAPLSGACVSLVTGTRRLHP
jgi:hypothetical protein